MDLRLHGSIDKGEEKNRPRRGEKEGMRKSTKCVQNNGKIAAAVLISLAFG